MIIRKTVVIPEKEGEIVRVFAWNLWILRRGHQSHLGGFYQFAPTMVGISVERGDTWDCTDEDAAFILGSCIYYHNCAAVVLNLSLLVAIFKGRRSGATGPLKASFFLPSILSGNMQLAHAILQEDAMQRRPHLVE
jgi:hypothetical protein